MVMDFISRLNPPRPVPVGLSLGGAITLQLLIDHPDSFPLGILISTGARMKAMPALLEAVERDFATSVKLSKQVSISPKTDPDSLQPSLEDILNCPPEVALGDFRACDQFDVRSRLAEIRAKVLVVTGEDDVFTPPKFGEYLAEHIPGAQWLTFLRCRSLPAGGKAG